MLSALQEVSGTLIVLGIMLITAIIIQSKDMRGKKPERRLYDR
jgi:hypothetical protein